MLVSCSSRQLLSSSCIAVSLFSRVPSPRWRASKCKRARRVSLVVHRAPLAVVRILPVPFLLLFLLVFSLLSLRLLSLLFHPLLALARRRLRHYPSPRGHGVLLRGTRPARHAADRERVRLLVLASLRAPHPTRNVRVSSRISSRRRYTRGCNALALDLAVRSDLGLLDSGGSGRRRGRRRASLSSRAAVELSSPAGPERDAEGVGGPGGRDERDGLEGDAVRRGVEGLVGGRGVLCGSSEEPSASARR